MEYITIIVVVLIILSISLALRIYFKPDQNGARILRVKDYIEDFYDQVIDEERREVLSNQLYYKPEEAETHAQNMLNLIVSLPFLEYYTEKAFYKNLYIELITGTEIRLEYGEKEWYFYVNSVNIESIDIFHETSDYVGYEYLCYLIFKYADEGGIDIPRTLVLSDLAKNLGV